MKLLWSTELNIEKTSPVYFIGEIVHDCNQIAYYFTGGIIEFCELRLTLEGDFLSSKLCTPNDVRRKRTLPKEPSHYSIDSFTFGDYIVSHKGEWGYQCHKNGKLIWTKSLRGYLYTDIELIDKNIVFGTAGYGGHFYSLNLKSGEIVFDFNTKGTSQYYYDEFFYICVRYPRCTDLLKVTTTGEVVESIRLKGLYSDYWCPFAKCGDRLYVVTLNEIKKDLFKPIISCISISN